MSVVSRVPEVALPRPEVSHRSIQVVDRQAERRGRLASTPRACAARGRPDRAGAWRSAPLRSCDSGRPPRPTGETASARPTPSLGLALAGVWWLSLQMHQSRSPQGRRARLGGVPARHRRDVPGVRGPGDAVSVALKIDASRLYLATAFPLGLVGLLVERKLARVGLHRARVRRARRRRRSSSSAASGPPLSSPRGSPSTRPRATRCAACGSRTQSQPLAAITGRTRRERPGDVVQHSTSPRRSPSPAPRRWW